MKIFIILILIINSSFAIEACSEKEIEKLKLSHDKLYKGYKGFLQANKKELTVVADDYLERSILMGLLAGDCEARLEKVENSTTVNIK